MMSSVIFFQHMTDVPKRYLQRTSLRISLYELGIKFSLNFSHLLCGLLVAVETAEFQAISFSIFTAPFFRGHLISRIFFNSQKSRKLVLAKISENKVPKLLHH